jgi:hypothetical protein
MAARAYARVLIDPSTLALRTGILGARPALLG